MFETIKLKQIAKNLKKSLSSFKFKSLQSFQLKLINDKASNISIQEEVESNYFKFFEVLLSKIPTI